MLSAIYRVFTIELPGASVEPNNPIYQFLYRRTARPLTDRKIRLAMIGLFLLFALMPILFALHYYYQLTQAIAVNAPVPRLAASLIRYEMDRATNLALILTALISFGLMVIGDLFTLAITAGSTDLQRNREHWELVTLTGIAPSRVVDAQQVIGQIRAWHFTPVEMAVRVTLIMLMLILAFPTALLYLTSSDSTRQSVVSNIVLSIVFSAVLGLWLVYEPYWRMRAMVATGVRIGTQARHPIMLILMCASSTIWMRAQQTFILLAVALIFSQAAALSSYNVSSIAFITVFVAVLLFISRSFYAAVTIRETQEAINRVFKYDCIER